MKDGWIWGIISLHSDALQSKRGVGSQKVLFTWFFFPLSFHLGMAEYLWSKANRGMLMYVSAFVSSGSLCLSPVLHPWLFFFSANKRQSWKMFHLFYKFYPVIKDRLLIINQWSFQNWAPIIWYLDRFSPIGSCNSCERAYMLGWFECSL